MAEQTTLPNSLTRHLKNYTDVEIIREAAEVITQALERLHRAPFKFKIRDDCGLVIVVRDRDGGEDDQR